MHIDEIIEQVKTTEAQIPDRMELLKNYPEPVSRYLRYHLPKGIPETNFGEVRMKGIIKIVNWANFRSTLFANPFRGFAWVAKVKMGILPIGGYDYFLNDDGAMSWKLFNVIPMMSSGGEDVARSAEGRARMEAAFFAHLLIHPEIKWDVISENEITAIWKIKNEDHPVHFKIGNDGSLKEIFMQRWGNPGDAKTFGYHTFGCEVEEEVLYKGVMIPRKGNAGWWFGEKAYDDGEFFRFHVIR